MRRSNPVLKKAFARGYEYTGQQMTLGGTINKSFIMIALLMVSAIFSWRMFFLGNYSTVNGLMVIGIVGGLISGLITVFKPNIAKMTAPIYAVFEGLALGGISAILEMQYPGIVIQAVALTMTVFVALLTLYKTGIIKATENFKLMIFSATFGIMIFYLLTMILGFFNINMPLINDSGALGIGFSLFIVGIAALNLVLDFDFIENGIDRGMPSYMEWYAAYGLVVTLVWLYIEILRLLSKFARRE